MLISPLPLPPPSVPSFLLGAAVWFSASGDLHFDARRDFADIGAGNVPIHSLRDLSYAELAMRIPFGVVFSTFVLAHSVE